MRKESLRELKLDNSRILIDGNCIRMLLTIRRNVEVNKHKNLFVDVNEDGIDCLLVKYDESRTKLFSINHDTRKNMY